MHLRVLVTAGLLSIALPQVGLAQAQPRAESASLAEGWTLLAKGDVAGAARVAGEELGRNQNSVAALTLLIDADLIRGGAAGGLGSYDRWLGSRRLDEPFVLRRIGRALLNEAGTRKGAGSTRLEALRALAADGDLAAIAALDQGVAAKSFGEARALASIGNERAVKTLLAELAATPGPKTAIIDALGDSGSKLAVEPLKRLLADPMDVTRASAADALGRLGATETIPQLKPLLNDPIFTVKLKVAGALLRLNDTSGVSMLTELARSEHGGIRIAAARELAAQPDEWWKALVRSLASDPDPVVRADAARLIAPYDPALANTVLQTLLGDENIAVRELASGILVDRVASDFATLRQLLHNADLAIRVKASARILELTR